MDILSDRRKPGTSRGSGFYDLPDEWPEDDLKRWNVATTTDVQRTSGRHKRQSRRKGKRIVYFGRESGTIRQMEFAYGFLISFLRLVNPDSLSLSMSERITFSVIVSFISYLQQHTGCHDSGIANRINHIYMALLRLDPDTDWDWLILIKKFHERRARPRDKSKHLQPVNVLLSLGVQLMRGARIAIEAYDILGERQATYRQYRNGLIIAVLSTTALRRGNLTDLRIGETLFPEEEWRIEFRPNETKTDIHFFSEIPEKLRPWADYFLKEIRPLFPGTDSHNHLWPSRLGGPLSDSRIYGIICEETKNAFEGVHVYPHLFRTAAATFISMTDPGNIDAAQNALGHSSVDRTERTYILASDSASRRHGEYLLDQDDVEY